VAECHHLEYFWTVGFLAGLIYIAVPYAYFFDRMALPDGLLSAFAIWMIRWTLHIAEETRPGAKAFKILGILVGAAMLTQTRAVFLFPIPVIVFYFWRVHQRPEFWKRFGTSVAIAFVLSLPVFLGGSLAGGFIQLFFHENDWLNFLYVDVTFEWYWRFLIFSLIELLDICYIYWTFPLALVLTASLVYLFRERQKVEQLWWLWFLIPTLIFLLLGSLPHSHKFLITVPPLILLAAVACDRLAHFILLTLRKLIGLPHRASTGVRAAALGGFMVLVLFQGIVRDLVFVKNPLRATYHAADRISYVEGRYSGHGIREAAQFLAKEAEAFRKKTGIPLPLLLSMERGNPAEGITVYLWNHPDVRFVPAFWWPKSPRLIPTGLRFSHRPSIYQTSPVMRRETTLLDYAHFVFPVIGYSREKFLHENPRFQKVWDFPKPGAGSPIAIFKNHPQK
jgi:GNAT superfamily N-acetyltransferase